MSGMCNMTVVKADLNPSHSFLCAPLPATERKHTQEISTVHTQAKITTALYLKKFNFLFVISSVVIFPCANMSWCDKSCSRGLILKVAAELPLYFHSCPSLYSFTSDLKSSRRDYQGPTKVKSNIFMQMLTWSIGSRQAKGSFLKQLKATSAEAAEFCEQNVSRLSPDLVLGCTRCRRQAA